MWESYSNSTGSSIVIDGLDYSACAIHNCGPIPTPPSLIASGISSVNKQEAFKQYELKRAEYLNCVKKRCVLGESGSANSQSGRESNSPSSKPPSTFDQGTFLGSVNPVEQEKRKKYLFYSVLGITGIIIGVLAYKKIKG